MNSILNHIAEAKVRYHKNLAKMPFEEKVKIIVELQKIDTEIRKKNSKRIGAKYRKVWQLR
jgi:hypothetical protein